MSFIYDKKKKSSPKLALAKIHSWFYNTVHYSDKPVKGQRCGQSQTKRNVVFLPDTLSSSGSAPLFAQSWARRERSGCAGLRARPGPRVQGRPLKQIRVLCAFKPQSLKHQLVTNGKKLQFEHLWDFFYLSVRDNSCLSHKVIWFWFFNILPSDCKKDNTYKGELKV